MAVIFSIYNDKIVAGADNTSDLGESSLRWRNGYMIGTFTIGTVSATGNVIAVAKVSGATGSFGHIIGGTGTFSGLVNFGNSVSIAGDLIVAGTSSAASLVSTANGSFATIVTAATASFTANLIVGGTSSIGNLTFADNRVILFGTGTGLTIGTGTNQKLAFWGATPIVRPAAYTPTNVSADRSYDANSTTTDELADVLGTLIADLQAAGLIG